MIPKHLLNEFEAAIREQEQLFRCIPTHNDVPLFRSDIGRTNVRVNTAREAIETYNAAHDSRGARGSTAGERLT